MSGLRRHVVETRAWSPPGGALKTFIVANQFCDRGQKRNAERPSAPLQCNSRVGTTRDSDSWDNFVWQPHYIYRYLCMIYIITRQSVGDIDFPVAQNLEGPDDPWSQNSALASSTWVELGIFIRARANYPQSQLVSTLHEKFLFWCTGIKHENNLKIAMLGMKSYGVSII